MAKILLADDDEGLRKATKRLLEAHGHDVTDVVDGIEAVNLLQHEHFDLVISDQSMPGMSGLEVLLRLRVAHNEVKFILYSGESGLELGLVCKKHDAMFFLKGACDLASKVDEFLTLNQASHTR